MSAQVVYRVVSSDGDLTGKQQLVENLYQSFAVACAAALQHLADDNLEGFAASVSCAVRIAATFRDCLDYQHAPVASAYLNSVFDYVITQLTIGRGARDPWPVDNAAKAMTELENSFIASHRRARP